jgi:hypothetical protein
MISFFIRYSILLYDQRVILNDTGNSLNKYSLPRSGYRIVENDFSIIIIFPVRDKEKKIINKHKISKLRN